MAHKETPWTPELVEKLESLYGTKSASEIGRDLGLSKNSVIGKAKRLGLCQNRNAEPKYRGLVGTDAVAEMMADDVNIVCYWYRLGFKGPHYVSAWENKVIESMGAQAQ